MARPVNQIANLNFLALLGQVQRPFERSDLDQRPGVEGTGFTLTASRGDPFTLRSQVDQPDVQYAQIAMLTYLALCTTDVVSLVQDGYEFTTENIKFKVLKVTLVKLHALALSSYWGLNSPSGAWLECDWELVAVQLPDPGE